MLIDSDSYCPLGTHCIRFLQCIFIVMDGRHTDHLRHTTTHHVYYSTCHDFLPQKSLFSCPFYDFLNSLQFPLRLHLDMIQIFGLLFIKHCITGNITAMFYRSCSSTGQSKELIVKENPAPKEDKGEAKMEEDKLASTE